MGRVERFHVIVSITNNNVCCLIGVVASEFFDVLSFFIRYFVRCRVAECDNKGDPFVFFDAEKFFYVFYDYGFLKWVRLVIFVFLIALRGKIA